jgi:nucleotide-binding universal stress UspA family protein
MIALKQLLVPTDFSIASGVALKYAKELATNFKATLHLLHVIEDMRIFGWTAPEGSVPPLYTLIDEMETKVHAGMEKLLSAAEREQFCARLSIRRGSPFVEIIRYARTENIDMIVLGTHGRGPIAHMLMGSVAERVVRKSPCPVLTVRHPEHEFVMP